MESDNLISPSVLGLATLFQILFQLAGDNETNKTRFATQRSPELNFLTPRVGSNRIELSHFHPNQPFLVGNSFKGIISGLADVAAGLTTMPDENSRKEPFSSTTFSDIDEHLLVHSLRQGKALERNLCVLFRELDGLNRHSTIEWVNYYLENSVRIDKSINFESHQNISLQPAQSRPPQETLCDTESSNSGLSRGMTVSSKSVDTKETTPEHESSPYHHSKSKSPSPAPPTLVHRKGTGGYWYTRQDQFYMNKFIEHVLKYDPSASIAAIIRMIAHRAPHHSRASWSQYIRRKKERVNELRIRLSRDPDETERLVNRKREQKRKRSFTRSALKTERDVFSTPSDEDSRKHYNLRKRRHVTYATGRADSPFTVFDDLEADYDSDRQSTASSLTRRHHVHCESGSFNKRWQKARSWKKVRFTSEEL